MTGQAPALHFPAPEGVRADMIRALGAMALAVGLSFATNAIAQETSKVRTVALGEGFALYVSENIQRYGREATYTTLLVQRDARVSEGEALAIYWSLATWEANCKTRKLVRISSAIYNEQNVLIERAAGSVSLPLDALSEIHLQYVCDGKLDDVRLSSWEAVEGRIALLAAIEALKKRAKDSGSPGATESATQP